MLIGRLFATAEDGDMFVAHCVQKGIARSLAKGSAFEFKSSSYETLGLNKCLVL